jgi:hypothetical protein
MRKLTCFCRYRRKWHDLWLLIAVSLWAIFMMWIVNYFSGLGV